ncbi:hypothetical protein HBN50_06760 [Halobacteriovorax sp. GB3]|uniref:HD domain-containing phosphohydrolase n=1 Tax=Halobacteriovorax sp. GB3 TaxID=2719615 RepID=UPI00235E5B7C|nr:HD domain-containing phosphohydrolase [Halobacteriovorax sp. GB3]MDD0852788.1 hypothetical protein [Halobacteriovorax sp. GB3]
MFKRTKILLLSKPNGLSDVITFNLESEFSFEVKGFQSIGDLKTFTEASQDFFAYITEGSMSLGAIKELYDDYSSSKKEVPFFVVANKTFYEELEAPKAIYIDKEKPIEAINNYISELFMENPHIKPQEYCPISFKLLTAFEGAKTDVYIQLPSGRYLKLFQQYDKITEEDVLRFQKKGVQTLYLKKRTAQWILKQFTTNLRSTIESIESGKKIKMKPLPKEEQEEVQAEQESSGGLADMLAEIKKERMQALGEESDELGPIKVHADDPVEEPVEQNQENEKIKKIEQRIDGTFALDEEFKKEIQKKTVKAVKIMAKKPSLKKLLEKMQLNRDPNDYVKNHVNLLTRVTCSLAHLMDWSHESTLEKLIFVSYMHDITLVEHPHLAKIQTLAEYKEIEGTLSDEEKRLFIKHPEDIRKIIEELEEAPVDADKIIYQHHELPEKDGFPNQLGHQRILPLASLFIIAHDLVVYIINHEDWTMKGYLKEAKEKYIGSNFTKILRKMKTLEL